jgi:hypothetical protein
MPVGNHGETEWMPPKKTSAERLACHQSANCFLFTAGVTLTFEVRGYWFTLLAYGTYGNFYTFWAKLAQCSLAAGAEVPATGEIAVAINPSLQSDPPPVRGVGG